MKTSGTDTNNLEVLWDGHVIASVGGNTRAWQTHRLSVVAAADTSRLTFRATGKSDGLGALIDHVRVAHSGNLIPNGSFELHGMVGSRNWQQFSELPGWSVTSGKAEIQRAAVAGIRAVSGVAKLELDSDENSSVQVDIITEPQRKYRLGFYYSPRSTVSNTDTNDINVWWGDQLLATLSGDRRSWRYFNFPVIAESANSTLKFEAVGASDSIGGFLDDVRLVADANLLANGSFETYSSLNRGDWGVFNEVPGWQASAGQFELQSGDNVGIGAFHGDIKLELDGDANSTILSHVATDATTKYHLGFAYSPRVETAHTDTNDVEVWWDSVKLGVLSGSQRGWQHHHYPVASIGAGTELEFRGVGADDSYGGLIDDVYVIWSGANCLNETGNQAPVAIDQQFTLDEDTQQVFDLSGTDPDGDLLSFTIVGQPSHGTLIQVEAGYLYQPVEHYNGADIIQFVANDGALNSEMGVITLQVEPVNDAPLAESAGYSIDEDSTLSLRLVATDIDLDPLNYVVSAQPAHGQLTEARQI